MRGRKIRFSMVAAGVLLSTVTAPSRALPTDPLSSQTKEAEQIDAGIKAAKSSTPREIEKNKPQLLEFGKHTLEVMPPEGFLMDEIVREDRKTIAFVSPKREDGSSAVLMINMIIKPTAEDKLPETEIILDGMLNPFRAHLTEYQEEDKEPCKINGYSYENTYYSGKAGERAIKGFVFVSRMEDGFCVMSGMDTKESFSKSESLLLQAIKSCKVLK